MTLEAEVEEPLSAELDPTMLHRIPDNLLSNALKFTEPGGTVTLRAHSTNGTVTMEVEVTGVGIDDALLPILFEAFARGSGQEDTKGNGLGLAITKHLTEMMGGDIGVGSEEGVEPRSPSVCRDGLLPPGGRQGNRILNRFF